MNYDEFLSTKLKGRISGAGISYENKVHQSFDFQRDVAAWALGKGRAAIFGGTGSGKTLIELDIASNIDGDIAIAAPLNVALQTVEMAEAMGVPNVSYARNDGEVKSRITLLNYERLDDFDLSRFNGFLADESSILKSLDGKTKTKLTERTASVPFRYSFSATPAPNDFMELGNQAEFLGIKTHKEMLAEYFIHDGGSTSKWRLKGHAKEKFWEWLSTFCIMYRMPSDLGYEDRDFVLPQLTITPHFVESEHDSEMLIPVKMSLRERQAARRDSVTERVAECVKIIGDSKEQWIIWCDRNIESETAATEIFGAEEVTGSMSLDEKIDKTHAFVHGKLRMLVTKPKILGLGSNLQNSHNAIFCGLSDSYEMFYQSVRRQYRYGQKHPVNVHIVLSNAEQIVLDNVLRKERDMEEMQSEMIKYIADRNKMELRGEIDVSRAEYAEATVKKEDYTMHLGDCVEVMGKMPSESIDHIVFSPPFASLYTYSDSERDMGNVLTYEDFFAHMAFAIEGLYRILRPGRTLAFHCMQYPTQKAKDGYIGIRDFRGDLIRAFRRVGFIFHSEDTIEKDPATQMQRTKALGLLYKQLRKDSVMSRAALLDYLITMRKPGENAVPVSHTIEEFPVAKWQVRAGIWKDINPSDTLQYMRGKDSSDERHIAPLQLEVIRRSIWMRSNPGEVIFSPYAGIGSEGYVAIEMGRRFIGAELKESYFNRAIENLNNAIDERRQADLFDVVPHVNSNSEDEDDGLSERDAPKVRSVLSTRREITAHERVRALQEPNFAVLSEETSRCSE